jgi:hypothetical protein
MLQLGKYFKNMEFSSRGLSDFFEGNWRDRNQARKYPRLS